MAGEVRHLPPAARSVQPHSAGKIADSDGDGRSNLEESIIGSDPFTVDTPWQPRPAPAGFTPAGPGSFTLSLARTDPAMRYRLQRSEDLVAWTILWWEEFDGDGRPRMITLDTTGLSREFYRFVIDQPDDDSDGLINWHEVILGTNPSLSDTDDDGLADGWEAAHGLNPTVKDTDGDGASDGDEVNANTDPKSDQSHPPVWRSIARDLVYDFYQYPNYPANNYGGLSVTASWNGSLGGYATLASPIALTALAARLDPIAFPSLLPAISTPGLQDSHAHGYVGLGPPVCPHATIQQRRYWLCVKPATATAIQRTVPIVVERTIDGTPGAPQIRMQTVTIPAGETESGSFDLVTNLTVNPPGNNNHDEFATERLLAVEVRAFQDEDGPHGSDPMYAPPQPDDGQPFGDLFSLWPAEQATFGIAEPIAGMLQRHELPVGTVKWSGDDLAEKADVATFDVQWWTQGLKHVNLQIGASIYHIYVNVPETGNLDLTGNPLTDQALIAQVGVVEYGVIGASGVQMRTRVALRYGQDAATGGTRQDAIRHSSWNAFAAEQVGRAKTLIVTTANEFHGRYFAAAFASNCTMDVHNNDVGATAGNAYFNTTPLKFPQELINEMEAKFDNGDLWAWTPPNANVNMHWHILKKSNRGKIFAP